MSEMIERVAKALRECAAEDGVETPSVKLARAAIAALREPTDEMIRAGFRKNTIGNPNSPRPCPGVPFRPEKEEGETTTAWLNRTSGGGYCQMARVTHDATPAWLAMIDSALDEKP